MSRVPLESRRVRRSSVLSSAGTLTVAAGLCMFASGLIAAFDGSSIAAICYYLSTAAVVVASALRGRAALRAD